MNKKRVIGVGLVAVLAISVLYVVSVVINSLSSQSVPDTEQQNEFVMESIGISYHIPYPVTIVLQDEQGRPIEGAEVHVRYHSNSSWDMNDGFVAAGLVSEDSIMKGYVTYRTNWRFNHNDEVDIKVTYQGKTYLTTGTLTGLFAAFKEVPIPTEQVCVEGSLFYCQRYVEKTTDTEVNGYWMLSLMLVGDKIVER